MLGSGPGWRGLSFILAPRFDYIDRIIEKSRTNTRHSTCGEKKRKKTRVKVCPGEKLEVYCPRMSWHSEDTCNELLPIFDFAIGILPGEDLFEFGVEHEPHGHATGLTNGCWDGSSIET